MKKDILEVLEPITERIKEVMNNEECQKIMEKVRQEYLASKTAKHTEEEWEKLKESLFVSCTLDYIMHDKKLKREIGKAFYDELNSID